MAEEKQDNTPYWCTCVDNLATCLGCGIDKLVFKVMGDTGLNFLKHRTYAIVKTDTAKTARGKRK
jgi:hypothetical protein